MLNLISRILVKIWDFSRTELIPQKVVSAKTTYWISWIILCIYAETLNIFTETVVFGGISLLGGSILALVLFTILTVGITVLSILFLLFIKLVYFRTLDMQFLDQLVMKWLKCLDGEMDIFVTIQKYILILRNAVAIIAFGLLLNIEANASLLSTIVLTSIYFVTINSMYFSRSYEKTTS